MELRSFRLIAFVAVLLLAGRTTPAQVTPPGGAAAAAVVQRAAAAHGKANGAPDPTDWVADGKVIMFTMEGPKATFDMTLQHKGMLQVQRIIKQPAGELKQGTDGTRSWESFGPFFTPSAQGRALQFIESQTSRSSQRLFNHQTEGLTLSDKGNKDNARVIEAEDRSGKKTKYHVDEVTSLVKKVDFVAGQAKDPFSGRLVDVSETYVFSDYRTVQGILTPFKVERFNDGNKTEEMQFTNMKYNTGLKDQDFHR